MAKFINVKIGQFYYNKFLKPIRTKKDLVLLLLDTINAMYLNENVMGNDKGNIFIKVDKMSRIFYDLNDKLFSLVFPFSLETQEESRIRYLIFDPVTDVIVDNKAVSLMRTIVEKMDLCNTTFERLIEEAYFDAGNDNFDMNYVDNCCMMILRMFTTESGYIRYDYDAEHQDGVQHPLNHLDINYSTKCTYKLGLNKRMIMDEFVDLLDVQTDCRFVT